MILRDKPLCDKTKGNQEKGTEGNLEVHKNSVN